jgi:hypothetical protein
MGKILSNCMVLSIFYHGYGCHYRGWILHNKNIQEVLHMNNREAKKVKRRKKITEGEEPAHEFTYPRRQTGIRILATLFFGIVVSGILEIIVFVVVIFQIIHALIAQKPNFWLIGFANRTIAYFYRVMRYVTFIEDKVPFPFSRFPAEIEKPEMR